MKELDNEYKRLIKIRYVLNNFKVRNKEDLEREVEGISDSAAYCYFPKKPTIRVQTVDISKDRQLTLF